MVDRFDDPGHRASGFELMTQGIPGDLSEGVGYSQTLYVKRITA